MQYDKRVTESMPSSNVCSSTGDGLALAEAAGAGLRNMELVQIHPLATRRTAAWPPSWATGWVWRTT